MTKNKGKGGKNRRKGKNDAMGEKRELELKEEGEEYAQVVSMLGNNRCEAYCFDGVKRLCHIRGKMRKRVWISVGDIVLVSLRDFQDAKADIIGKYTPDEARMLKAQGALAEGVNINETEANEDMADPKTAIEFFDGGESSSSEEERDKYEIIIDDI